MSEKDEVQTMDWGVGSDRDDRGWMFYGCLPVTEADWQALEAFTRTDRDDLEIDQPTLVGRWDYDWSSWYDEQDPDDQFGGAGSPCYESQLVGVDVSFADEPIWHRNANGEYVKEVPANLGAYHKWSDGMATENRAGPQPDTASAQYLADNGGVYYWDEGLKLYDVMGADNGIYVMGADNGI